MNITKEVDPDSVKVRYTIHGIKIETPCSDMVQEIEFILQQIKKKDKQSFDQIVRRCPNIYTEYSELFWMLESSGNLNPNADSGMFLAIEADIRDGIADKSKSVIFLSLDACNLKSELILQFSNLCSLFDQFPQTRVPKKWISQPLKPQEYAEYWGLDEFLDINPNQKPLPCKGRSLHDIHLVRQQKILNLITETEEPLAE